jgi:broad specificity phosphatase PhoE
LAGFFMGQIFLVRHGQASFGQADYDQLSPLGQVQAQLLGAWWASCGLQVSRVVTGSMQRHRQTAQACLAELPAGSRPAQCEVDADFDEYDHDQLFMRAHPQYADPLAAQEALAATGNPRKAFAAAFAQAFARWQSGAHDAEYRESWAAFRARTRAALERAAAASEAATLVFTSGGPIASITQSVLGLPDDQVCGLNWSLANSAVTKLFARGGRVTLGYLNSIAHLERAGAPGQITYR